MINQFTTLLLFVVLFVFVDNKLIYGETSTELQSQAEQTIPVLDLNEYKYGDESSKAKFIQEVADALHEYGFFALENSDVDENILRDGFNSAISFFNQDHSYKHL